MVKVTVRTVSAGFLGTGGLLALGGGQLGCAPVDVDEGVDATREELTVVAPGSARLDLAYVWQPTGTTYGFAVRDSSTDEFIRAGESLSLSLGAYMAWNTLHPNDALSSWPGAEERTGPRGCLRWDAAGRKSHATHASA